MDPLATLVNRVVEALAPWLPHLLTLGDKTLDAALETAVEKLAWEKAKSLWERLRPNVQKADGAQHAAALMARHPEDSRAAGALELHLEEILRAEPLLAEELAKLLDAAAPRISIQTGPGSMTAAVIGGDLSITVQPPSRAGLDEKSLRAHYLRRLLEQTRILSLAGIDPAVAANDRDSRVSLDAVYTALLTKEARFEYWKTSSGEVEQRTRPISVVEQMDQNRRLVLLGDPGSGKSTFSSFVVLCMAGEILESPEVSLRNLTAPLPDEQGRQLGERQPWSHGALFPVRVVLREFAARGLPRPGTKATARHLWEFLRAELSSEGLHEFLPHLRRILMEDGGFLIFDGLDEVPEAESRRDQIRQSLESFVQGLDRCRVLLTSRTYAYRNQDWKLAGFQETVLAPFSDGQIRSFIQQWYAHVAQRRGLKREDALGRAAMLERAIFGSDPLRELAGRPLLLTLMASLQAWRGGSLPEKREELYANAVDLLLHLWESQRDTFDKEGKVVRQPSLAEFLDVGKDKVRKVLERLAYEAQASQPGAAGTADIPEDKLVSRLVDLKPAAEARPALLVEYLRDRAGLLESRAERIYSFPHRTFQEYLAACHLTEESFPEELAKLAHRDPGRWREVVLLAGSKVARGTIAVVWQLAETLCWREPDEPEADLADAWGAQLAAQIVAESVDLARVSPANKSKLERLRRWLVQLLRDDRFAATERVLAGRTLANLGDLRFDPEVWHLPKEPLLGFLEIPSGSSSIGSDLTLDHGAFPEEQPRSSRPFPPYYMARYPVTVRQFAVFVEAAHHRPANPESLSGLPNHPVVHVSWYDAAAYCAWLNGRLQELAQRGGPPGPEGVNGFWDEFAEGRLRAALPSEVEWERAARGGDERIFPWGNEADPERSNHRATGIGATSAVGCFPGGASPYGCEEMSGNVWEWTRSLWGRDKEVPQFGYPYHARDGRENPGAPREVRRIVRGGSFFDEARYTRCAYRNRDGAHDQANNVGFRVAVIPG